MADITLRSISGYSGAYSNPTTKGSPLTAAELDANFDNINRYKIEADGTATSGYVLMSTGTSTKPTWIQTTSVAGLSGYSGISGYSGFSGISGYSGRSGFSGLSGFSGATGPTTYPASGVAVSTGSTWSTSLGYGSANTANNLVQRDGSGNFSAGTITATLSGTASTANALASNVTITNPVFTGYKETVVIVGTVSTATYILDLSQGNIFDVTLGTNVTFTFTNVPPIGTAINATVIVRQPASSPGKTATFTGAKYTDGVAPILSTGASQIDVLTFFTLNGGSFWFGTFAMANVS